MLNWQNRIIPETFTIKQALAILDEVGVASNVLFVVDADGRLLGSVTDGDIRRGFLKDASVRDSIASVMNPNCKKVFHYNLDNAFIVYCRQEGVNYVPVLCDEEKIIDILSLQDYKEIIPVDAVIMAGGKGERLMPLTKDIPKPMLKVGNKPIIEYNIDRLQKFGVRNIHISINYLGQQIKDYFRDGSEKGLNINYVNEKRPLGTIGSITLVNEFEQDIILLMNSDLLTNIDFGDFYREFIKSGADMGVATIPHHIDLPYAILELEDSTVVSLKEKPRYTYFANAGIYLLKREILHQIPKDELYNATDLMDKIIRQSGKIFHYPILGYWLDIGRLNDFYKAQEDIKHIYW
ncbi:MAG TPA: nucleotidyltransferase family protein [Chitinophagaceae bacterium]